MLRIISTIDASKYLDLLYIYLKFIIFTNSILFCMTNFANANETIPTINDSDKYFSRTTHGIWKFEYGYQREFLRGVLHGKNNVDSVSVLQNTDYHKLPYPGSHDCSTEADPCLLSNIGKSMFMDKHMFTVTYRQSSELSWAVKLNYVSNSVDMYEKLSNNFPTSQYSFGTSGIGDMQLLMTNRLTRTNRTDVNLTLGVNLPLGSIDETDGINDMSGNEGIAPYNMQLGSGTYDIITQLAFAGFYYGLDYGFNIYRITRTGLNPQYYNLGDNLKITGWAHYTYSFGTQLRMGLIQNVSSPIEGRDERVSDNTRYSGGKRFDVLFGLGQKIGSFGIYVDYAYPVLQYVNGVQMKTTGIVSGKIEYTFL